MKYIIYITALLATVLIYVSCQEDFLVREPRGSVSVNSFFANENDALAGINATYAALQDRNMYSELYPKTVEGADGDIAMDNTDGLELTNYAWTASFRNFDGHWQEMYEGIFRANLVLQNVPGIEDMDSALKDRILGEAKFLRGLYYFHLMNLFGGVPLVLEADPSDPSKAILPRSTVTETYNQIVSDLSDAIAALPTRAEYDPQDLGRATEEAAKAILGKVHLYSTSPIFGGNTSGYSAAATLFEEVINDYGYALIDYEDLWVVDNNDEQIFEVQYADVGGSIWAATDNANANETQIRPALNLPNTRGGNGNLLPNQNIVDAYQVEPYTGPDPDGVYDGNDPRMYWSIWKPGDFFDSIEPTFEASWTPTGYALKKGLFPVTDRNEDGEERNIPIIRLGDVYLMYAECLNAMSPRDAAGAVAAINAVRDRVNMPTYPNAISPFSVSSTSNQQEIFDAIVHERRLELFGEYTRYNDLRRWELADDELNGWQPHYRYFPIPSAEFDVNELLEQNPGY